MSHRELKVFALGGSTEFGRSVAARLGIGLAAHEEREFEDGEHKTRPLENVRGCDVFVIHPLYGDAGHSPGHSVNDKLCRLLFFIGALKDASAARVTAVMPYLCYARKDRKTKARDPVTTRYVAALFEAVGTDRVVTMDVHNEAAFQNAFRCPTDHLEARPLFVAELASRLGSDDIVVVSPDAGGVKRARRLRESLEGLVQQPLSSAFLEKYRSGGVVSGEKLVGDVSGRTAVIVDDLISTGTTIRRAIQACAAAGAVRVLAAATHGAFAEGAAGLLAEPALAQLLVTDSIASSLRLGTDTGRLRVVTATALFAAAIRAIHEDGSIVELLG